jgi:serine/threonine protein kinase
VFLEPGARLDRYQIVEPLGRGGMGEVYRATDTRLHRSVAIKILGGDLVARPDLKQRLAHEGRVLSALSHPNICTLYDVVDADQLALIMELLEGETLAQRLRRGPVPLRMW